MVRKRPIGVGIRSSALAVVETICEFKLLYRSGEVELPDENLGANWNEVISRWEMLKEELEPETAYLKDTYSI